MAFPPAFLEELRRRVPVSRLVVTRVKLTKKGREFSGLCPFHSEKSPSFFVNDDKNLFKCFGCGKSGDQITFAMEAQGLTFPEAVAEIASIAGLEVPQDRPPDPVATKRRKGAEAALEATCLFFEAQLAATAGADARGYLSRRGLTAEDVGRFRLGWAPDSRSALKAHLAKQGIPEDASLEAGVLKRGEDGAVFDFFRGRVIFPIFDRRGRPVAFGGRVLGDGQPKYLNSADGPLFHKGQTLYALHIAREAAARKQPVIVAEGYMDVIALHKAGFTGAVAPLGTALTDDQLEELWRLTAEPVLCLDGDAAGQRAAAKAAERALPKVGPGRSLRFLVLPGGQDPDEVLRSGGARAFTELMGSAVPLVDHLWRAETTSHRIDTPEARAALQARLRDLARSIADPATRELYEAEFRTRLATLLGDAAPRGRFGERPPAPRQGQWVRERPDLREVMRRRAALTEGAWRKVGLPTARSSIDDRVLLLLLCRFPALIDLRREELALISFADPTLDQVRDALVGLEVEPDTAPETLVERLADLGVSADCVTQWRITPAFRASFDTLDEARALERVDHMLAAMTLAHLRADMDEARALFEATEDQSAWNRFLELQALHAAGVDVGDPHDP
ncbi:MAG: DNA primase [Alphaproteobacteria bacterium]|nr:DNA primase [Alphaproteobacteria bacterium]